MYLILYTHRKWMYAGLLSIATGLFANVVWMIPQHREHQIGYELCYGFSQLIIIYAVKDTHIVALTMIPCIFIKITTSSAMAILTTCAADLVPTEMRKTLMFSSAIWARGWFLWAPFIGASSYYGALVPLTVFAALSVVGGLLCVVVDDGERQAKEATQKKLVFDTEKGEFVLFVFVDNSLLIGFFLCVQNRSWYAEVFARRIWNHEKVGTFI